jgi:uncharacterized membrane protein YccC
MDKTAKLKEAIKVALAFALAYMIALNFAWMNPNWAGFAVVMIALPTAGQSFAKGFNRMLGTIPGALVGFILFAIAGQERWLLAILGAVWIGFTNYRMIRSKNKTYLWQVAGFVALIILTTSPITSENVFHKGLYRTLETALGIAVYAIVTTLLWPRTNYGSIKKACLDLLAVQVARFQATKAVLENKENEAKLVELRGQNVKQLNAVNGALVAEGSESYEVTEVRPAWERFMETSTALIEIQNRIEFHIEEFVKTDINSVIPELAGFNQELEERFKAMQSMIGHNDQFEQRTSWDFTINRDVFDKLSEFEKAAVETGIQNLKLVDQYTIEMYTCLLEVSGDKKLTVKPSALKKVTSKDWYLNLIPDSEAIRGAIYAGVTTFLGFCVYFFFNPIGHSGWFQMTGTLALIMASSPQLRIIIAFKPIALVFPFYIPAYVFILPHLSGGLQLFIFMFGIMFFSRFFLSGAAQFFGGIAIINMIAISNPQAFSFVGVLGGYVFTLLAIAFVFGVSYLVGASRPEKAVLRFTHRYFGSAKFLLAHLANTRGGELSIMDKIRLTWHRNQVKNLADRINTWSKAIDYKLFPNVTPEQVGALVGSLEQITLSIKELYDVKYGSTISSVPERDLRHELEDWNRSLQQVFADWSIEPNRSWQEGKQENINTWMETLETKMEKSVNKISDPANARLDHFYNLLIGYRGITAAVANYARIVPDIDLKHWKEERFS